MFGETEVSIQVASDVFLSSPANGQALIYDNSKWKNLPIPGGSAGLTAAKDTATTGNLTLTAGSSAQLTKFSATLTTDRIVTLAGSQANAYFDMTFIETNFNGHTITVTNGSFSHVFSYPTYVRYVYIGSAWERVL